MLLILLGAGLVPFLFADLFADLDVELRVLAPSAKHGDEAVGLQLQLDRRGLAHGRRALRQLIPHLNDERHHVGCRVESSVGVHDAIRTEQHRREKVLDLSHRRF